MSCLEHIYVNWLLEDIARENNLSIVFVGLDGYEKKK
jgi:hypothetical protein